jgi:hypothetical protein
VLSHQCPSPSRHGLDYREVRQTADTLDEGSILSGSFV